MLDEPTNHLDILSENIIIQALQQYEGSFVVVSHNRHFVSQVANKIWYIEDMKIKEYPGTFDEYEYWVEQKESKKLKENTISRNSKPKSKKSAKPRNDEMRDLKKLRSDHDNKEAEIEEIEESIKEIEKAMALPESYSNPEKLAELTEQLNNQQARLDMANTDWEQLVEQIDELE